MLLFFGALWRGASPERLLAGTLFVAASVEAISGLAWPLAGPQTEAHVGLLADILTLAAILAVALHANRLYPLWLGGAQIVALALRFADGALTMKPQAYAIMQQVTFCLELMIMAGGLVLHVVRTRDARADVPSWSSEHF
jgi:hypothetical protein